MTEKIVLIVVGALIGLISSIVTTLINSHLQTQRQKREWERQDRVEAERLRKIELDSVRELVTTDQLSSLTGEQRIMALRKPTMFACFAAGTKISMDNESVQHVESIAAGDTILGYEDRSRTFRKCTVNDVDVQTVTRTVVINKRLRVSESQLLYTTEGELRAIDLRVGVHLVRADRKAEEVVSIKLNNSPEQVYSLSLTGTGALVAEDICVADYPSKQKSTSNDLFLADEGRPISILPNGELRN